MGLILSRQIESRLATLALLETMVMTSSLDVNALLSRVTYFRIESDVARFIKNMAKTDSGVVVTLKEDWKAMARTQVAAFSADTAIELVKDTFVQHFQAQIQASITAAPDIGASAVADRVKTFTETFINTLIDDTLKKSVSAEFWGVLYPSAPGPVTGETDKLTWHQSDEKDRTLTLNGSDADIDRLFATLSG